MIKPEEIRKLRAKLLKPGWASFFGKATPKNKGNSGGVGFVWRHYLDVCSEPKEVVTARVAQMWFRFATLGELVVASIYGHTGKKTRSNTSTW